MIKFSWNTEETRTDWLPLPIICAKYRRIGHFDVFVVITFDPNWGSRYSNPVKRNLSLMVMIKNMINIVNLAMLHCKKHQNILKQIASLHGYQETRSWQWYNIFEENTKPNQRYKNVLERLNHTIWECSFNSRLRTDNILALNKQVSSVEIIDQNWIKNIDDYFILCLWNTK